MSSPRSLLLVSIFILGLGCFLLVGGSKVKQEEWPMYLGLTCVSLAVCVAALFVALQAQTKRIEELERRLVEKHPPT